jgi:D-3-phosphoglycerate dehydrogenase
VAISFHWPARLSENSKGCDVKVIVTDWGFPSLGQEREIFGRHGIELEDHQCKTEEEVAAIVADADVVMAQWAPVKAKAIAAMKHCKGIVRYGIGLDNVDLQSAKDRGIPVRNVPDYCLNEVADHTMALLLALQRQVSHVQSLVRSGKWSITPPQTLPPLRSCTLGLLGFGRIARLVARRAQPFGITTVAFDPYAEEHLFSEFGTRRVDLPTLFSSSDILSLHSPLTDETRHVVNARNIALMKSHALIVNTGRGGLVHTTELTEALRQKKIAGAALDVLEVEPIGKDDPLLLMENVIITSHNAWYSSASVSELQRLAALAAVELLKGKVG